MTTASRTTASALVLLIVGFPIKSSVAQSDQPDPTPRQFPDSPQNLWNCKNGDKFSLGGSVLTPPPVNERQYDFGETLGKFLARATWSSTDMDPISVEEFAYEGLSRISEVLNHYMPFLTPEKQDAPSACRQLGMFNGFMVEFKDIIKEVVLSCGANGNFQSLVAAGVYCELSSATGGLMPPGQLDHSSNECADAYSAECTSRFELDAQAYTSPTVDDCTPWLDGTAFTESFEQYRFNLCIYE